VSVDSVLAKLVQLKKVEADLKKEAGKYETDAAKKRSAAQAKRKSAERTSSASSKKSLLDAALKLEKEAGALSLKAAVVAGKLADNSKRQRQENSNLARARKGVTTAQDRTDSKRREVEKRHAREVARIARPTVRHIHEVRHIPTPKREQLRVLYLTANPRILDQDPDGALVVTRIRVDKEIRDVRAEVKSALLRDLIEIDHWPAATAMDLLNGLNDKRPHIVHFSGHGGGRFLEFDDGQLEDPQAVDVSFEHLARVLGATDQPPLVLVLNACDTLDGAEELLAAVPVVIATTTEISDQAASLFSTVFYRAIASGQNVRAAIEQARVIIDMLAGGGGDVIASVTRDDIDLNELVLIKVPEEGDLA